MKAVLYYHKTDQEFLRVFNLVKELATITDDNIEMNEIKKDFEHIYIFNKDKVYKFNRFDSNFIKAVEEAISKSPYPQYEGPLHIINIDDRFTNPKYFTITKNFRYETFELNKDLIIEDLYNKNYVTNTNKINININKKFGFDI